MEINITSGECLNEILSKLYEMETFIPFNEAMINGTYTSKLFSKEFIEERSKTHNVSIEEYTSKLKLFLEFLDNIDKYDKVTLWFGDEPFCKINTKIVVETLTEYNFKGNVILNIVDERNGEIKKSSIIK